MPPTLDIILSPTGTKGVYQAEGRDAQGNAVASTPFHYRPDLLTTHEQLKALEQGATLGQAEASAAPPMLAQAEAFGHDLYQRLFAGELGACWADLRAGAQAAGEAVRLRLRAAEEAPELETLPWEFLHDGVSFLAPDRGVLLARGAAGLPDLATPAAQTGPLSVLVVVSSPLNLPDLQAFDADEELAVIYQALDEPLRRGQIHLAVVDEASPAEIQRALIARDYQVVHFIGHGNFDEGRGGYLVVEDETGEAAGLSGADFAGLLAGRGVRLVLLSSCLTARASPTQAYRSLAAALLRRGQPAAVAMQYPILISSARTFYQAVYRALVADRPLDVAIAEGQQALYLARGESGREDPGSRLDWATPTLFSRGDAGWRLGIDARAATPPAVQDRLSALGGLERLERGFVGRAREQRQIRRAFLGDQARAALIHGFGGIGKTVLATRVAARLAETERFDGVLGLRARPDLGPDEVLRAFNDFLTGHGIAAFDAAMRSALPLSRKVDELVQVLRQVRLVVIFDNCEDWLEVEDGGRRLRNPDLAALLAGLAAGLEQGSKLLLTSRYTFDLLPRGRLGGAVLRLPLGELSPGEAVRLMGRLPGLRETDFGTRLRVHQAVGGHPLVLNLFAERAARDGVDHVLAEVRKDKTVQHEAEEVAHLLLNQIVDRLSAEARHLLERAGVMRRAGPRAALEALAGTHRIGEALAEMLGWGLLAQARYDDELCAEPELRFAMHALVREYAAERLGKGEEWREALLALAGFYEGQAGESPYLNIDVFNRLEARHYYFTAGEYQRAGEIDQAVVEPLLRWGLLDTARELNRETARCAAGRVRAAALHHWGIVEQEQGNYAEAVRLYEQSRQVLEQLGDKSGVARSLHQLGMLQQDQGNYAEAVRLYEQSRQVLEQLGDKSGVASSLHQLGMLQQDQGNYAEAVRLYEQSLKLAEQLGDKSGVASSLGQLGKLAQAQGRHREALGYYARALALFRALNSPYAGLARRDLANIRTQVGEAQFAVWWQELSGEAGELGPLPEGPPSGASDEAEADTAQPQGLGLDQLVEQIVEATISVLTQGDPAQRGQLWQALGQLRGQAAGQAGLAGLVAFVDAVRWLLEGRREDVELAPPFEEAWRKILGALGD
jgi:tetratricopeptide (TPR) repeat protein